MVKCDMGKVIYSGSSPLVKAELTTLLMGLKEDGIINEKDIKRICNDALKTEDELKKDVSEKIRNLEDMIDVITSITEGKEIDDEKLIRVIKGFDKE